MVIEFTESVGPLDQEMVAIFSDQHISEEAVREYICKYGSNVGYNEWIVFMTKQQYENLKDVEESTCKKMKEFDKSDFYDDLRVEQQGGII